MPITVGIDGYNTVAEADSYFENRLFSDDWTNLPDSVMKEQYLRTATLLQDTLCTWDGSKTDEDQNLEFPRNGETEIPANIKKANLEIVIEIISQQAISFIPSEAQLKQMKGGSAQLIFFEDPGTKITVVNSIAKYLLRKYGHCFFGDESIITVELER